MTRSDLEALSTKQLLARLKRLLQCEESLALSDREAQDYEASGSIEFKASPEWAAAYHDVKEVLARREHIPKGIEAVKLRQDRARKGKSLDRKMGRHTQW